MDRPKTDPFWDHVEEVFDGAVVCKKCKFCRKPFANDTSISRIKWHLSGEKGRGVATCRQVPKEVQEGAFQAMCGGNKRQKSMSSSSNVSFNAVNDLTGGTEQIAGEGITTSRAEAGSHMENMAGGMMHIDASITAERHQGVGVQYSPHTQELMDVLLVQTNEEDWLSGFSMDDALQSGQRTEQVGPLFEQSTLMVDGVDNLAGDGGGIQTDVQGVQQGAGEERASSCSQTSNDIENTNGGNHMENIAGEMMQNDRGITPDGLVVASQETREDAFHAEAGEERTTSYTVVGNDIENVAALRAQEERVPGCFMRDAPESGTRTEQGGQINGVDTLAGDGGRIQVEFQGTEKGVGEGRASSLAAAGNRKEDVAGEIMHIDTGITAERLISDAHETGGDALKATEQVSEVDIERTNWQAIASIAEQMEKENGGLEQPSSSSGRTRNTSRTSAQALPTSSTKPVGQAFEENTKLVLSWLMNNGVSSIVIYGMGGVGKTTMLQHILKRADISHHVYWVTVSQDFSIHRLQNLIAKRLGLDLSNEDDELHRAIKLSQKLKKEKWILILDDLWNSFELHKVGIPVPEDGCKLIVTTRSEKVCHQMNIEKKIKLKSLSEDEAWTLFMQQLTSLSPEVKEIAQSVVKECDGLPLGIITIAGAMKGVDDIHEWRNAFAELRQSRFIQDNMEEDVFRVLRFSYTHLNDPALQRCFLYCALFPEDFEIPRDDLISYLIDEGVIKRLETRWEEFDKGHSMLNRLETVCLIESCERRNHDSAVKMHDLIRDMAIQIQQEDSSVMVKAGAQLIEMPDEEEWKENLVTVSLMQNYIKKIPFDHSRRCPRLSTLLLCRNIYLQSIENSFLEHLKELKILDLSDTFIEQLPESVSDLESLVSLLLTNCKKLRYVPSLKRLRALKRLDLKGTELTVLPQGMEGLSNLRYLGLKSCGGLPTEFPSGILSKLSHLQVFVAELWFRRDYNIPVNVKGKELACLKKMETLKCFFENYIEFVGYLNYRDQTQSPRAYQIFVGLVSPESYLSSRISRSVLLSRLIIHSDEYFQVTFPNDIEELMMEDCNGVRCLHDASLNDATELEVISIKTCSDMESLVSPAVLTLQSYNGIFSGLKRFNCNGCKSMKKLFPLMFLRNLKNLEVIYVSHCEKMEEIIGTGDEGGAMDEASSTSTTSNAIIEVTLPKLRIFYLGGLPELESICSAKLICPSIIEVSVLNCKKLKRMPFSLPLQENGQPCPPSSLDRIDVYPEEWWERVVEWDHPNAKDVLRPFVKFSIF